ncbi:MAG TPA: ATP-binding protein [Roseiflexaceae bacterium]|nr:ATP-binding protein [Roseiflexaceae bacterium]
MFVDRAAEIAFLNRVLRNHQHPGPGQLVMLYGRRRVGKSTLLRYWAESSGAPFVYWVAEKEPAAVQRRKLFALLIGADPSAPGTPAFANWSDLWQVVAPQFQAQRRLLILDELPYAADADGAMLSALQHAWDQHFEHSQAMIVLCGSHVRTMELLLAHSSPLFGRMTGQWRLQALPFGALREFLPGWPADQQVAVYAMVGGVPAYLSWFRTDRSLLENVRDGVLAPGSLALGEVLFLLYDELREPRAYLAILEAIGNGQHTFKAIKDATLLGDVHLPAYLTTLQEMRYVERRLPVTIPPAKQRTARQGRYHLSDPFMRFYFRFIHPHRDVVSYAPERILPALQSGLRAFVGQTAWEDLARQWVRERGYAGALPFVPEVVGSHWSRTVQADVVAITWAERSILIGECKWGDAAVDRQTVRDLLDRTVPLTVADLPDHGAGWRVYPALFARAGATPAARKTLEAAGGMLIDLRMLFEDLAKAS